MKKPILILLLLLTSAAIAQGVTNTDAQAALDTAEADILLMHTAGFNIGDVNETYRQALVAFDSGYFGKVVQLSNQISATKSIAFDTYEILNQAKEQVYADSEKGLDVTNSNQILQLADSAFDAAEYSEALRLAQEAAVLEHQPLRARLSAFLRTNWKLLFGLLVIIIVAIYFSYEKIINKYVAFGIKKLEDEEAQLVELLGSTDEKYYKHKTMSSSEYKNTRNDHEDKIAAIRQKKASLKAKKR